MDSKQQPLAGRDDVQRSCKSLETLLNILNDYCEAAGAVALLQKKLSKALRDTAGLKVTGQVAGAYFPQDLKLRPFIIDSRRSECHECQCQYI